jgi:hypothetical protein
MGGAWKWMSGNGNQVCFGVTGLGWPLTEERLGRFAECAAFRNEASRASDFQFPNRLLGGVTGGSGLAVLRRWVGMLPKGEHCQLARSPPIPPNVSNQNAHFKGSAKITTQDCYAKQQSVPFYLA